MQTCEAKFMRTNGIINDFSLQFGVKLLLDEKLLIQQDGRFFLLNDNIKVFIKNPLFHAGICLGKVRSDKIFPSFNLLSMLAKHKEANYVIIDKQASWLFICGRDIFRKSILQTQGKIHKNEYVLILNEFKECLGFGKILDSFEQTKEEKRNKNRIAITNVLDIGDFLRRERDK
jgi:ribosome biogenesis protein Nip4